jgi:hypothetical protein
MRMRVRADYGFMALCLTCPIWTCLDVRMNEPRTPITATPGEPTSLRSVPMWVVRARGFTSTLAHDIAQERARRWISSAPLNPTTDSGR